MIRPALDSKEKLRTVMHHDVGLSGVVLQQQDCWRSACQGGKCPHGDIVVPVLAEIMGVSMKWHCMVHGDPARHLTTFDLPNSCTWLFNPMACDGKICIHIECLPCITCQTYLSFMMQLYAKHEWEDE